MADDQMFEQSLQLGGKAGQLRELGLQHLQFDDHVAEQLAARGVGKRAVVGQFVNLADVMQKRSCQQQVAVDLWIVPAHQVAGAEQRHDVIEQSADVGMMKRLGRGGIAVALGDLRIRHEQFDQRLEVRILEGSDKL